MLHIELQDQRVGLKVMTLHRGGESSSRIGCLRRKHIAVGAPQHEGDTEAGNGLPFHRMRPNPTGGGGPVLLSGTFRLSFEAIICDFWQERILYQDIAQRQARWFSIPCLGKQTRAGENTGGKAAY